MFKSAYNSEQNALYCVELFRSCNVLNVHLLKRTIGIKVKMKRKLKQQTFCQKTQNENR